MSKRAKNEGLEVICEHEVLELSKRDQKEFVESILSPPPVPSKKLISAARQYEHNVKAGDTKRMANVIGLMDGQGDD